MEKKDGGVLTNWQIHTLDFTDEEMEKAYPGAGAQKMMISAIVVHDEAGRWPPGYHMRTSCVVKLDIENGILETINTMYKLEGPAGDPYISEDLGNTILTIHY